MAKTKSKSPPAWPGLAPRAPRHRKPAEAGIRAAGTVTGNLACRAHARRLQAELHAAGERLQAGAGAAV